MLPHDTPAASPRRINLTGQTFGRLTVRCSAESRGKGVNRRAYWLCDCSCGATVEIPTKSLRNGSTVSCGCLKRERIGDARRTHGMSETKEFRAWCSMRQRCEDATNRLYYRYGGRGIRVFEKWRNSFEAFFADVGPAPSPDHSIDRINNDGNYEPGNVRWSTRTEQNQNKSTNRIITYNGTSGTLAEWSERTGISAQILYDRLTAGWTVERLLHQPVQRRP